MQQSNTYIITFSVILTVVLGFLLSGTSQLLGPIQKEAEALDNKKQILGAVMDVEKIATMKPKEIKAYYESTISSKVVDINGEEVAGVTAETVDIAKNYKKPAEDRLYPVYVYHEEGSEDKVVAYILPVFGAGLWDSIWGYLALKTDLNTIEGVTFSHAGETPGLGARITTLDIQQRYQGKEIFGESGELMAVVMQKGEGKDYSSDPHKVDGMSGATLTAKGVNEMLKNYLSSYLPYLEKVKGES
mgnify:CR=1 FL=1